MRYLFDGGELVLTVSGAIAANQPFTVWTERVGGTDVTSDMRGPDGAAAVTVQTDSDGEVPYLRGPDGIRLLYRDIGSDTRSPWYSSEAFAELFAAPPSTGSGVSDHGALDGLNDDDHPQYLTEARADARYVAITDAPTDGGGQSSDLTYSTGDGTVTANWTAALNVTTYTIAIEPLTTGAGATSVSKTAAQLTHTFTGLTNGAAYLVTLTIGPSNEQRSLTATPAAATQNLLAGKVFSATVADSTIETGHPIAHATDGDLTTRWISQPTSPMDMTVDLGGVYNLDRVVIVFAGNTIKNYTVSLSTNGSTYTPVATGVTNNTEVQTITVSNFTTTSKGRYLRISAADRWNASFGNSIWEVSAYGALDPSFPTGTISGLTASAISNTSVLLSWTYTGSTLTSYSLKRNGAVINTLPAGTTSYTDGNLSPGGTYSYELVGTYAAGSNTNTAAQSVTTPAPSTPTTGTGTLAAMIFVQEATWQQDLNAAVEAGFTWVRMDIPIGVYGVMGNGTFTPNAAKATFYRQACQQAKAAGMKICLDMAALYNNTGWTDAQYNSNNALYMKAVSQNIGDLVDLWQIFNEHDGNDYRTQGASTKDVAYFTRLRDALAAMRTALRTYSTAPVTTTVFGYPINQTRYNIWQSFWDVVSPAADVIGVHGYPEASQTTINLLATYMTNLRNRYSKPVCILEFGFPNVATYGTEPVIGDAIVRQIAAIMAIKPFCAALYQLRDRGAYGSTNGEMVFGILKNDFSKKTYSNAVSTEVKKWKTVTSQPAAAPVANFAADPTNGTV